MSKPKKDNKLDLDDLGNNIVDNALIVICILGSVIVALTGVRAVNYGMYSNFLIQAGLLGLLIWITVKRKELSLNFKVYFICLIGYLAVLSGFYKLGFLATGKVYMTILPIFFSFVVSFRAASWILTSFISTYLVFGILYNYGILNYDFDVLNYTSTLPIWIMDAITLFMASFGLLYVGKFYREYIEKGIHSVQDNEKELISNEQKYRLLFESSNDSIIIMKEDKFIDCNEKTLEIFKCERDYLVGRHPYDFSPEYQRNGRTSKERAFEIIGKVYAGEPQFFQWQHIRPNGELFDAQISLNRMILDGEYHIQVVLRDITDQLIKEEELARYRKHLEVLVEERTHELEVINDALIEKNNDLSKTLEELQNTQDKLIEIEKMASIGVLTTGVSHEINNPLNYIQSGLYSLQNTFENPELFTDNNGQNVASVQQEILENISEGVKRINTIVHQLNQFNISGETKFEEHDLNELAYDSIHMYQSSHEMLSEIHKEFSDTPILLKCDSGKIHQVLLNLLSNAYHAAKNVDGTVSVTTKVNPAENLAVITFTDTGEGIPKENIKRIFDPFFSTREGGAGLGLSISYRIIEEHKGKIEVQSEPEKGTTVTVSLPLI